MPTFLYFPIARTNLILLGIEHSTAHPMRGFTMTKPATCHYDVVGSFLRPTRLKDARAQHAVGTIDDAALETVENECIAELIEKEKAAGLPFLTDGEFRHAWARKRTRCHAYEGEKHA